MSGWWKRAAALGLAVALSAPWMAGSAWAAPVRVKDLGRFDGWRDNALVGYGLVTGLAGSGDSPRSEITRQALRNVLGRLGSNVTLDQVQSRNVAAVIVTATLPPSANVGDHIDINVSSIGDARSLGGGTLLMTPLYGPDQVTYALAQGPLTVGGFRFDADRNREQKNYPTSASLPGGASVETAVQARLLGADGALTFLLKDADVTTATRMAEAINRQLGAPVASVLDADAIAIRPTGGAGRGALYSLIARVESVMVEPDVQARVVINERSGTVVAGGDVRIDSVVVAQGDVRVSVVVDNQASQPLYGGGYPLAVDGDGVRSLIVSNTKLSVAPSKDVVARFPSATVADLVQGLSQAHVDTRGVIAVLQAVKAAGALHADIIVQ